ncbi:MULTISPECIES: hypothetical protein [unclassified Rhodococcus (in: high G+C Gram-positive bacteria)]|uniref:hypothetical protein n=1 Tax=unclassified Rhodococcus (in: high G+C Gram-positive bacteria) TaxID=192944 RepID=UPI00295391E7|nr:hypothetical protein [Rhodococcus sp. IEGM 27]MDV8030769.1 hypothetical protein [Rhodococcus sp. IEGM 27]
MTEPTSELAGSGPSEEPQSPAVGAEDAAGQRSDHLSATVYAPAGIVVVASVVVWFAIRWLDAEYGTTGLWWVAVTSAAFGAALSVATAPMMVRLCAAVEIATEGCSRRLGPAALTAGVWFGAVMLAGGDAILPAWLALSLLCVWAAWIDHFTLRFPLTLIRLTTAVGLMLGAFAVAVDQDPAAGGRALLAGVLVFAFNLAFAIVTRGYPGLADVRLSCILGAALGWVGWMNVLSGMLLPNVLALLVMTGVKAIRRQKDLGEFGFAPFLIAGTAVAIAVPPLWWIVWI